MMRCVVLAVGIFLIPISPWAQPVPGVHTIQISDQQIEGIRGAMGQCEARMPLACSKLFTYLDGMLETAKRPIVTPPSPEKPADTPAEKK